MKLGTHRLPVLAVVALASALSVCGGKDQPAAPPGESARSAAADHAARSAGHPRRPLLLPPRRR